MRCNEESAGFVCCRCPCRKNQAEFNTETVGGQSAHECAAIIEIERCKSSPRFETVATIARELNISIDAAVFQNIQTDGISKSVIDFFSGKSEEEIQKYILLCQQADTFKSEN